MKSLKVDKKVLFGPLVFLSPIRFFLLFEILVLVQKFILLFFFVLIFEKRERKLLTEHISPTKS
jgi:hypothetical protein